MPIPPLAEGPAWERAIQPEAAGETGNRKRGTDDNEKQAKGKHREFADVPASSPDRLCIQAVVEAGIMGPADAANNLFRPRTPVARRELAKALCRAAGWKELSRQKPTFSDVLTDDSGFGWMERLAQRVALASEPAGEKKFRPDATATRAEAAELLCLVRGWAGRTHMQPVFDDVGVSDGSRGYVERLCDEGVVKGDSAKPLLYRPRAACTRAELATLICRAYGLDGRHQAQSEEKSK